MSPAPVPADGGPDALGGREPDDIDRAFAELQAQRAAEDAAAGVGPGHDPDTPMWLSHHWPAAYDRCAVVGGLHVCRRCLFLYPTALVLAVVVGFGSWWPHGLDAWALWLLPLPGVVDFVLDNVGLVRYSARRQAILTAIGSFAVAVGYVRYLDETLDALVWTVVGTYLAVCVAGMVIGLATRRSPA